MSVNYQAKCKLGSHEYITTFARPGKSKVWIVGNKRMVDYRIMIIIWENLMDLRSVNAFVFVGQSTHVKDSHGC